jgi:type IV pilus biogenesis protein CpaD/CtpE
MKNFCEFKTGSHPALDAGSYKIPRQARNVLMSLIFLSACTAQQPPMAKVNVVDKGKVEKPVCPDWSSPSWGPNHENYDSSNYGCSTSNNLAEMILDKNDLVVGKTAGSDVSRSSLAVTRYRSGAALSTGVAE